MLFSPVRFECHSQRFVRVGLAEIVASRRCVRQVFQVATYSGPTILRCPPCVGPWDVNY